MQGDNADDGDFDPLETHTDIGPLKKADACFIALKHLDLSSKKDRKEAQDTVTRTMIFYDMANRPDMVLEVMRYVGIQNPERDKRLYISAIIYHQDQYRNKKKGIHREELRDTRSALAHMVIAQGLAKEINLEQRLLEFEDEST